MDVAIKLMEVPKSIYDRCVLHDIFTEILVLDRFKDDPRVSHLFDYGTDDEYYWIIMKRSVPALAVLSFYIFVYASCCACRCALCM